MIITIDGPSGSGKSTTARAVARRLGFLYLDTGAMYRAVALAFAQSDAQCTNEDAQKVLEGVQIDITYDEEGGMRVWLNGTDVTDPIRDQQISRLASQVSQLRAVREKLVEEQRRIARDHEADKGGVVLDGRDTGTVVFPNADLKIYMVADARERARRRQQEYAEQDVNISLDEVHEEILNRDRRDQERDLAPLRRADDAVELDTTDRSIEEQVEFVTERVQRQ